MESERNRGMMSARFTQRGHRISRGFARAPEEYDQWEGFDPDEDHHKETEEEERVRHHHGQLRRDPHSKI